VCLSSCSVLLADHRFDASELLATFLDLPVVVIADHVGGLLGPSKLSAGSDPTLQPGFQSLITLATRSKVLIKISGLYRSSTEVKTHFADMAPVIERLASEVPDSLMWASDWPHTGDGTGRVNRKDLGSTESFRVVDNASVLRNLKKWISSDEDWSKMMTTNPGKAYT